MGVDHGSAIITFICNGQSNLLIEHRNCHYGVMFNIGSRAVPLLRWLPPKVAKPAIRVEDFGVEVVCM